MSFYDRNSLPVFPIKKSVTGQEIDCSGGNDLQPPRDMLHALRECRLFLVLFMVALILPTYTSFSLGSLRLSPYRIFLIMGFIPCLFSLFSTRYKLLPADFLVLLGTLWAAASLIYHHGAGDGFETGGIFVMESLGAYLLGRTMIRTERDYVSLVALLVFVVLALLPCTLVEALSNKNLFGQASLGVGMRLGLHRARGPFDHPIVFGVFCASVFGMSWFCFPKLEKPIGYGRALRGGVILCTTITSVSSGPLTALMVQVILVVWNYLTSNVRRPWQFFSGFLILLYIGIDLMSNRTPMRVFLTYLTFSSQTAYNRLTIWEWGFHQNVLKYPVMGIGLNEWTRPSWMHSSSMDNFWLVLMVRHGLPCFLSIAAAVLYLLFKGSKSASALGIGTLHKGWTISIIGVIVAASTVHLWNALLVYFFFILGAGAWFCDSKGRPEAER